MQPFRRLDRPDEIAAAFDTEDEVVLERLGGPTLLRVAATTPGRRPRVVACLLHGNEDSGFRAVADLLRSGKRFPFDLWVFVGNVEAALADGPFGHRYLDGQEDFNRVWGRQPTTTRERRMAAAVLGELAAVEPEAVLDLHNTSGENPPHAIVPAGDGASQRRATALAAACADVVLSWRLSAYTLMEAFAPRCPAIAVECGMAGQGAHTAVAADALDRFLRLGDVPSEQRPERHYEMCERVVVRPGVRFAFGGELDDGVDLVLAPGLDQANFGMLFAATTIGHVRPGGALPLQATDMAGRDTTAEAFAVAGDGRLLLRRDITPVMMTRSVIQARRDCLFYIARTRR